MILLILFHKNGVTQKFVTKNSGEFFIFFIFGLDRFRPPDSDRSGPVHQLSPSTRPLHEGGLSGMPSRPGLVCQQDLDCARLGWVRVDLAQVNCYGCRLGPVPLRSLRNRVLIRLPLSWSDLKTIWVEEISIEQRLQNILPGSIKCPTQSLIILGSLMEVLMNACISVNQSLRSCKLWQAFPTSPIVRFQRSIVLFREAPKFSLIINFMTFRIYVYIWNSYLI